MPSSSSAARPVAVAVLAVGACVAVVRLFWVTGAASLDALSASGPDSAADLLVVGCAAVGALLTTWLGLGFALAALAALPGATGRLASTLAQRLAPAMVRRAAALMLGTALTAAGAVPAMAHADGQPATPTTTSTASTSTSGASASSPSGRTTASIPPAPEPGFGVTGSTPVNDAPAPRGDPSVRARSGAAPEPGFADTGESSSTSAPVSHGSQPSAPLSTTTRTAPSLGPLGPGPTVGDRAGTGGVTDNAVPGHTVTVVRGDSLWRLAARHLGPEATPQQIAREWRRWYALNRTVIGSDPDLILVGQVLSVPAQAPDGGPS